MPVGKGSIERAVKANSEGAAAKPVAEAKQIAKKPTAKKMIVKEPIVTAKSVITPSPDIVTKLGGDLPYYLL